MAREVGIWLRSENRFQRFGHTEVSISYDQLIADGWSPIGIGEATVVFGKNTCNSQVNVHTRLGSDPATVTKTTE